MSDFEVTVKIIIPECNSKQEAIDYVEEYIGLSEFSLDITASVLTASSSITSLTDEG